MSDLKYKLYCFCHKMAKNLLGKRVSSNDMATIPGNKFNLGVDENSAPDFWSRFISNSLVPFGNENESTHYAGYVREASAWCLPSWIWTNAAIVRVWCLSGKTAEAIALGEKLMNLQLACGGWIVRNDYDKEGVIPILAPNDSAYIANNAFLTLFEITGNDKYLDVAIRCADWIIDTARSDGMVYTGYDMKRNHWSENHVIVDVGFTAGLFARLFEYTQDERFKTFLSRFVDRFIELFYIPSKHGFCTSINKDNKPNSSMFGRGQAWALEGLIPAYIVLKTEKIRAVIDDTINNILNQQCKDGGWPYNFSKKLMGKDCKAVSVLAKNVMDWYQIHPNDNMRKSSQKALNWCMVHTANEGEAIGGIFSYCVEGAVVHNLYTSSAFVYASAYAIELEQLLKS